jgi:hypothetical protein
MISFVGGRLGRGNCILSFEETVYRYLKRKSFHLGYDKHNRTTPGHFGQKHDVGEYLHFHYSCAFNKFNMFYIIQNAPNAGFLDLGGVLRYCWILARA